MYDTASITPRSEIKHSPPSSPTTEVTDSHKRNHSSSHNDAKDMKMFPAKDMHATHMLGNQLNPASSVAQKMSDQLYMEMEAQSSVYTPSTIETGAQLIGPMFPGKQLSNVSFLRLRFLGEKNLTDFVLFRHEAVLLLSRKVHRFHLCLAVLACQQHTATHLKVWSSCLKDSGNKVLSSWWNKHSTLTVSRYHVMMLWEQNWLILILLL